MILHLSIAKRLLGYDRGCMLCLCYVCVFFFSIANLWYSFFSLQVSTKISEFVVLCVFVCAETKDIGIHLN